MGARPNVVVIMTDQQRWDTLGATGNAAIRTPHLDALAAGGALFDLAFVPIPLCTPSRACLFTGQYPTRHGVRGNVLNLSDDSPNLLRALRDAGYATYLAGKDHLFTPEQRDRLFDDVARYDHFGRVEGEGPVDPRERAVRPGRRAAMFEKYGERDPHDPADQPTARITDAAIGMVGEARAAGRPFFLWLSYPDPHPPYIVPEPYASMYRDVPLPEPVGGGDELAGKPPRQRITPRLMEMEGYDAGDLRRLREIYCGAITFIDDQIGRFVASLDAAGLREDTLIVFMSDHGDYLGDHGMVRKSPTLYDCLVRIPLIVSCPGRIPSVRIGETMVESVDIAPTLLELAGVAVPAAMEGRSLVPLLTGEAITHRDTVFAVYGTEGEPYTEAELMQPDPGGDEGDGHPKGARWFSPLVSRGQLAMLRTARWKLVYYQGGEGELYDMEADPNELRNRYDDPACADVRTEMTRALLDRLLAALPTRPARPVADAPASQH